MKNARPVIVVIAAVTAIAAGLALSLLSPSLLGSPIRAEAVLASCRKHPPRAGITVLYPLEQSLFPPEISAPTIRWRDGNSRAMRWIVAFDFGDSSGSIVIQTGACAWKPSPAEWERITSRSIGRTMHVTIVGIERRLLTKRLSAGSCSFGISADSVGAPIFYREVILPFIEAVKDPSKIAWRYGAVSSTAQPPAVLQNLHVCGNCHSFSRDGSVLGMDVDYANDKGAYAIVKTGAEIVLSKDAIVSWADFRRHDDEPTFGLLSAVSPDGRYVLSTVKDRSVFVPRPDLEYSQLFFPIKGILVCYDRLTKRFAPMPGADDKRFVSSNPHWSPDGKRVLFIRANAYPFLGNSKSVLLSPEDEKAFFSGRKEFKYDIYEVPFNDGKGGTPKPLAGASSSGMSNYFPRFSPDGRWIVYCQAANFSLLQPDSRLFIMPSSGGTPRLMRCNTNRMNSWHSWSPNGKWLVFSSKANTPYTQLFLAHIDEQGNDAPAVLLENFTRADRAANIPEFVDLAPDGIRRIREAFIDDYSWYRKGMDQVKVGDLDGAYRSLRKSLEIKQGNVGAHVSLAILFSQWGRTSEAMIHYSRALELDPRNSAAHYNLGLVYDQRMRYDSATTQYRQAIEGDSTNVEALNNLGIALVRLGKSPEAERHFRKALEINPYLGRTRMNLKLLMEGRLEEMLRFPVKPGS